MSRTLYRVVHEPTLDTQRLEDFMSDAVRGNPLPADPVRASLHGGISVFNTENQARNKAIDYPFLGDHIAAIQLADGTPLHVERTLSTTTRVPPGGGPPRYVMLSAAKHPHPARSGRRILRCAQNDKVSVSY